jgi:hypothetical protein
MNTIKNKQLLDLFDHYLEQINTLEEYQMAAVLERAKKKNNVTQSQGIW